MNSLTRLSLLLAVLTTGQVSAATQTFTNSAGITLSDSGAPPTLANPYPSSINVAGLSGTITKLTVTLTGFSHTFPGDVDMVLVAPDGKQAVIMSDVGGGEDLNGVTITIDDDAGAFMSSGLASGSYKPTNGTGADSFPAPGPVAGNNVALSTFSGILPTGVWSLYVVDDATGDSGTIASWSLTITTPSPANTGDLVISEFRLRGPNGPNDEFVEIQNATGIDHVVQSIDGSSGYALAASNGVARFVIPNGTVIPSGGHYLGINSSGYSLASYPAGNGATATGNAVYTTDIPDNAGIALFRTSIAASFNLANRLDAVGSTSEASSLYKEGTGYPGINPNFNIDYSFYRDLRADGVKDTQNNSSDFLFQDTNGTSAGAGQRLGAPGPENLTSPIRRSTGTALVRRLVDPAVASSGPPHRIRDFTSSPATNSTFGTFSLRRKFVNNTGANVTRLRFRIVEISTFPAPSGTADLRARTCSDVTVPLTAGGNTTIRGTTLEQPPSQPNGGAFNSTLSAGSVTNAIPLANGASIDVQFLFGIQQTGAIKLAIIPETLPASAAGIWFINADTDNFAVETENFTSAITSVIKGAANVNVNHVTATGVLFQMQRSPDLATWTDIGVPIPGSGLPGSFLHAGAASQLNQFYRLKEVK